eukprot:4026165-Amphidinium_carterae.1
MKSKTPLSAATEPGFFPTLSKTSKKARFMATCASGPPRITASLTSVSNAISLAPRAPVTSGSVCGHAAAPPKSLRASVNASRYAGLWPSIPGGG